jgi:hypothetical protein
VTKPTQEYISTDAAQPTFEGQKWRPSFPRCQHNLRGRDRSERFGTPDHLEEASAFRYATSKDVETIRDVGELEIIRVNVPNNLLGARQSRLRDVAMWDEEIHTG